MKMYIRSDSHFNIVVELIDEIDEEQFVYNEDASSDVKRKSSSFMHEKQVALENNIANYYQGESFPVKGWFCIGINFRKQALCFRRAGWKCGQSHYDECCHDF